MYLSCIVIIVIGNGLVLFGLARFKILRHPSNIYVGVLSGVDLTLALSFSILTSQVIDATLFQGLVYCQFRVIILTANLLASQLLFLGMHHTQTYKTVVVCFIYRGSSHFSATLGYHIRLCTSLITLIARFMGPSWGPSGADRTQVGPMLAPRTLLYGYSCRLYILMVPSKTSRYNHTPQGLSYLRNILGLSAHYAILYLQLIPSLPQLIL